MNKKNASVIMASGIVAVLAMAVLAHTTAFAFSGGAGGAGGSGNEASAKSTANAVNYNTGSGTNSADIEKNSNEKGKQENNADQSNKIDQDAIAKAISKIDQNNNGGKGADAK
jgi:hypothetical protein